MPSARLTRRWYSKHHDYGTHEIRQTSDKIADRVRNLRSSAVRDLFARGGSPGHHLAFRRHADVSLLPQRAIQKAVHAAITDERAVALQYGSTNGRLETRRRFATSCATSASA